jgi:hypothetical protein
MMTPYHLSNIDKNDVWIVYLENGTEFTRITASRAKLAAKYAYNEYRLICDPIDLKFENNLNKSVKFVLKREYESIRKKYRVGLQEANEQIAERIKNDGTIVPYVKHLTISKIRHKKNKNMITVCKN